MEAIAAVIVAVIVADTVAAIVVAAHRPHRARRRQAVCAVYVTAPEFAPAAMVAAVSGAIPVTIPAVAVNRG